MVPEYCIAVAPNGKVILGFNEWSDLWPRRHRTVPVKALYASSAHFNDTSRVKIIEGRRLFEVKTRLKDSTLEARTEFDIFHALGLQLDSVSVVEGQTGLLAIPYSRIYRKWQALAWPAGLSRLAAEDIARLMQDLVGWISPARDLYTIGSRVYAWNEQEQMDIDVALLCSPSESLDFRSKLALLRSRDPRFRPSSPYFSFPMKVCVGRQEVDFFPCLPADEAHPLKDVMEWELLGSGDRRFFRICDASLGQYAWPAYRVDTWPFYVVLMSNGFRGALAPFDEISAIVDRIRLEYRDKSSLVVDMVTNPWLNLSANRELFDYNPAGL